MKRSKETKHSDSSNSCRKINDITIKSIRWLTMITERFFFLLRRMNSICVLSEYKKKYELKNDRRTLKDMG